MDGARLQLQIPEKMENCVPKPIIPQFTVRVVVKTPCCHKMLASVIMDGTSVRFRGNARGEIDVDGVAMAPHRLILGQDEAHRLYGPPGNHMFPILGYF